MKKAIENRIVVLTNDIETLQKQKQTILDGLGKLKKALQEADLTILANQSKINELKSLLSIENEDAGSAIDRQD